MCSRSKRPISLNSRASAQARAGLREKNFVAKPSSEIYGIHAPLCALRRHMPSPKRGDSSFDSMAQPFTMRAVAATCTLLVTFMLLRGSSATDTGNLSDPTSPWRNILIVDAGSSGCRMHAYRWRVEHGEVFVDPKHDNLKVWRGALPATRVPAPQPRAHAAGAPGAVVLPRPSG